MPSSTSWKQILETPALKGRISLLDDTREVIALALLINGRSVNSTDSESLDKARATLKQIKPQVKMFRSDVVDTLIRKEVAIAHTYSLEALQAWKKTGGKVDYVIASEGGTKAIDSAVILKNAPHLKEAHELINFFLSPESNVQFVQHILAGPVLKKTREMLPAELKNHKGLFPPAEQMKKLESIRDVGESGRVFDRMWTEFKSM